MPPVFRTSSADEARALLARHHVGRLAYAYRQRVDIEPLHYALDGDWLYLRTQQGTKLSMLEHQPWVAFEVDEVRGLFDWESVVVHGSIQRLDPHDGPEAEARWAHAVAVFRRVVPEAFEAGDPTPERDVLVRVHLAHVDGRAAHPR
ncbi:MAG: pyridoxamine 5'-phosphate oxidase family protein [Gemmatimonadaceae bacterium]|nr:pyridoxamine 5'-phosphate oxidase family protein [Gemmatimonadaceae bacterium]